MTTRKFYQLCPLPEQNQQSFGGKCFVEQLFDDDKLISETLYSYATPIIRKYANGNLERLYDGWTLTTGKHIYAFCQLRKQEFLNIKKG